MFVGLGASGVIPVCHGLSIYGYQALDDRMGLNWVLFQGFLYIFGAFLVSIIGPFLHIGECGWSLTQGALVCSELK